MIKILLKNFYPISFTSESIETLISGLILLIGILLVLINL
jgi:hypothetical protein